MAIENINLNGTEHEIKDDNYVIFEYQYEAVSISGNGDHTFNPTNSIPEGYTEVGIVRFGQITTGLAIPSFIAEDGTVKLVNYSGTTIPSVKPMLKVRLHKN